MIAGRLYLLVVVCAAATPSSTPAPRSTAQSPVLMKILKTIDEMQDDHLFEVTLKLLRAICVCMHDTLMAKEQTNENNLQNEEDVKNSKESDLYKKIYNKTCFDLRQELASRLNHKFDDDDDYNYTNTWNCGRKIEMTTKNIAKLSTESHPIIKNETKTYLERVLFKALVQTKKYHKYNIRRHNLFGNAIPYKHNPAQHSIIVIVTLHPKHLKTSAKHNKTIKISDNDLNSALQSNSSIEIDILDTTYNPKINRRNGKKKTPKITLACMVRSVYAFLVENEKKNRTKVFKMLRKKNSIKIYTEVITRNNHSDYIDICCNNSSAHVLCGDDNDKKTVASEHPPSLLSYSSTNDTKIANKNYKDTLSKIMNLVKLYGQKLRDNNKTDDLIDQIEKPEIDASVDLNTIHGYSTEKQNMMSEDTTTKNSKLNKGISKDYRENNISEVVKMLQEKHDNSKTTQRSILELRFKEMPMPEHISTANNQSKVSLVKNTNKTETKVSDINIQSYSDTPAMINDDKKILFTTVKPSTTNFEEINANTIANENLKYPVLNIHFGDDKKFRKKHIKLKTSELALDSFEYSEESDRASKSKKITKLTAGYNIEQHEILSVLKQSAIQTPKENGSAKEAFPRMQSLEITTNTNTIETTKSPGATMAHFTRALDSVISETESIISASGFSTNDVTFTDIIETSTHTTSNRISTVDIGDKYTNSDITNTTTSNRETLVVVNKTEQLNETEAYTINHAENKTSVQRTSTNLQHTTNVPKTIKGYEMNRSDESSEILGTSLLASRSYQLKSMTEKSSVLNNTTYKTKAISDSVTKALSKTEFEETKALSHSTNIPLNKTKEQLLQSFISNMESTLETTVTESVEKEYYTKKAIPSLNEHGSNTTAENYDNKENVVSKLQLATSTNKSALYNEDMQTLKNLLPNSLATAITKPPETSSIDFSSNTFNANTESPARHKNQNMNTGELNYEIISNILKNMKKLNTSSIETAGHLDLSEEYGEHFADYDFAEHSNENTSLKIKKLMKKIKHFEKVILSLENSNFTNTNSTLKTDSKISNDSPVSTNAESFHMNSFAGTVSKPISPVTERLKIFHYQPSRYTIQMTDENDETLTSVHETFTTGNRVTKLANHATKDVVINVISTEKSDTKHQNFNSLTENATTYYQNVTDSNINPTVSIVKRISSGDINKTVSLHRSEDNSDISKVTDSSTSLILAYNSVPDRIKLKAPKNKILEVSSERPTNNETLKSKTKLNHERNKTTAANDLFVSANVTTVRQITLPNEDHTYKAVPKQNDKTITNVYLKSTTKLQKQNIKVIPKNCNGYTKVDITTVAMSELSMVKLSTIKLQVEDTNNTRNYYHSTPTVTLDTNKTVADTEIATTSSFFNTEQGTTKRIEHNLASLLRNRNKNIFNTIIATSVSSHTTDKMDVSPSALVAKDDKTDFDVMPLSHVAAQTTTTGAKYLPNGNDIESNANNVSVTISHVSKGSEVATAKLELNSKKINEKLSISSEPTTRVQPSLFLFSGLKKKNMTTPTNLLTSDVPEVTEKTHPLSIKNDTRLVTEVILIVVPNSDKTEYTATLTLEPTSQNNIKATIASHKYNTNTPLQHEIKKSDSRTLTVSPVSDKDEFISKKITAMNAIVKPDSLESNKTKETAGLITKVQPNVKNTSGETKDSLFSSTHEPVTATVSLNRNGVQYISNSPSSVLVTSVMNADLKTLTKSPITKAIEHSAKIQSTSLKHVNKHVTINKVENTKKYSSPLQETTKLTAKVTTTKTTKRHQVTAPNAKKTLLHLTSASIHRPLSNSRVSLSSHEAEYIPTMPSSPLVTTIFKADFTNSKKLRIMKENQHKTKMNLKQVPLHRQYTKYNAKEDFLPVTHATKQSVLTSTMSPNSDKIRYVLTTSPLIIKKLNNVYSKQTEKMGSTTFTPTTEKAEMILTESPDSDEREYNATLFLVPNSEKDILEEISTMKTNTVGTKSNNSVIIKETYHYIISNDSDYTSKQSNEDKPNRYKHDNTTYKEDVSAQSNEHISPALREIMNNKKIKQFKKMSTNALTTIKEKDDTSKLSYEDRTFDPYVLDETKLGNNHAFKENLSESTEEVVSVLKTIVDEVKESGNTRYTDDSGLQSNNIEVDSKGIQLDVSGTKSGNGKLSTDPRNAEYMPSKYTLITITESTFDSKNKYRNTYSTVSEINRTIEGFGTMNKMQGDVISTTKEYASFFRDEVRNSTKETALHKTTARESKKISKEEKQYKESAPKNTTKATLVPITDRLIDNGNDTSEKNTSKVTLLNFMHGTEHLTDAIYLTTESETRTKENIFSGQSLGSKQVIMLNAPTTPKSRSPIENHKSNDLQIKLPYSKILPNSQYTVSYLTRKPSSYTTPASNLKLKNEMKKKTKNVTNTKNEVNKSRTEISKTKQIITEEDTKSKTQETTNKYKPYKKYSKMYNNYPSESVGSYNKFRLPGYLPKYFSEEVSVNNLSKARLSKKPVGESSRYSINIVPQHLASIMKPDLTDLEINSSEELQPKAKSLSDAINTKKVNTKDFSPSRNIIQTVTHKTKDYKQSLSEPSTTNSNGQAFIFKKGDRKLITSKKMATKLFTLSKHTTKSFKESELPNPHRVKNTFSPIENILDEVIDSIENTLLNNMSEMVTVSLRDRKILKHTKLDSNEISIAEDMSNFATFPDDSAVNGVETEDILDSQEHRINQSHSNLTDKYDKSYLLNNNEASKISKTNQKYASTIFLPRRKTTQTTISHVSTIKPHSVTETINSSESIQKFLPSTKKAQFIPNVISKHNDLGETPDNVKDLADIIDNVDDIIMSSEESIESGPISVVSVTESAKSTLRKHTHIDEHENNAQNQMFLSNPFKVTSKVEPTAEVADIVVNSFTVPESYDFAHDLQKTTFRSNFNNIKSVRNSRTSQALSPQTESLKPKKITLRFGFLTTIRPPIAQSIRTSPFAKSIILKPTIHPSYDPAIRSSNIKKTTSKATSSLATEYLNQKRTIKSGFDTSTKPSNIIQTTTVRILSRATLLPFTKSANQETTLTSGFDTRPGQITSRLSSLFTEKSNQKATKKSSFSTITRPSNVMNGTSKVTFSLLAENSKQKTTMSSDFSTSGTPPNTFKTTERTRMTSISTPLIFSDNLKVKTMIKSDFDTSTRPSNIMKITATLRSKSQSTSSPFAKNFVQKTTTNSDFKTITKPFNNMNRTSTETSLLLAENLKQKTTMKTDFHRRPPYITKATSRQIYPPSLNLFLSSSKPSFLNTERLKPSSRMTLPHSIMKTTSRQIFLPYTGSFKLRKISLTPKLSSLTTPQYTLKSFAQTPLHYSYNSQLKKTQSSFSYETSLRNDLITITTQTPSLNTNGLKFKKTTLKLVPIRTTSITSSSNILKATSKETYSQLTESLMLKNTPQSSFHNKATPLVTTLKQSSFTKIPWKTTYRSSNTITNKLNSSNIRKNLNEIKLDHTNRETEPLTQSTVIQPQIFSEYSTKTNLLTISTKNNSKESGKVTRAYEKKKDRKWSTPSHRIIYTYRPTSLHHTIKLPSRKTTKKTVVYNTYKPTADDDLIIDNIQPIPILPTPPSIIKIVKKIPEKQIKGVPKKPVMRQKETKSPTKNNKTKPLSKKGTKTGKILRENKRTTKLISKKTSPKPKKVIKTKMPVPNKKTKTKRITTTSLPEKLSLQNLTDKRLENVSRRRAYNFSRCEEVRNLVKKTIEELKIMLREANCTDDILLINDERNNNTLTSNDKMIARMNASTSISNLVKEPLGRVNEIIDYTKNTETKIVRPGNDKNPPLKRVISNNIQNRMNRILIYRGKNNINKKIPTVLWVDKTSNVTKSTKQSQINVSEPFNKREDLIVNQATLINRINNLSVKINYINSDRFRHKLHLHNALQNRTAIKNAAKNKPLNESGSSFKISNSYNVLRRTGLTDETNNTENRTYNKLTSTTAEPVTKQIVTTIWVYNQADVTNNIQKPKTTVSSSVTTERVMKIPYLHDAIKSKFADKTKIDNAKSKPTNNLANDGLEDVQNTKNLSSSVTTEILIKKSLPYKAYNPKFENKPKFIDAKSKPAINLANVHLGNVNTSKTLSSSVTTEIITNKPYAYSAFNYKLENKTKYTNISKEKTNYANNLVKNRLSVKNMVKKIQVGNSKKEVMTVNTHDFFSKRLQHVVTPMYVQRKLQKTRPRHLRLRSKKRPIERELMLQDVPLPRFDEDFYQFQGKKYKNLDKHARGSTFMRPFHLLPENIEQRLDDQRPKNIEHKKYFMESFESLEDDTYLNRRGFKKSRNEEAIQFTTQRPTRRSRRTIFFLSPTLSYDSK